MKRFLNVFATLYISFAIITAYTAISANLPCGERDLGTRINIKTSEPNVYSSSSLDRFDPYFQRRYEEYTVTVWTSPTCVPCKKYIREEVPTLLRSGFMVYIFDSGNTPNYVKAFPTVTLSHDNDLISVGNYWKARDIKKVVDARTGLKNG